VRLRSGALAVASFIVLTAAGAGLGVVRAADPVVDVSQIRGVSEYITDVLPKTDGAAK
jgi:hypothetical protein